MFRLAALKLALLFAPLAWADLPLLHNDMNYDQGHLGQYPLQTYVSEKRVNSPRVNVIRSLSNCDDGSQIFLGPHGGRVEDPGPMILDANGSLVWSHIGWGKAYNFRMQEYKGQPYITFWKGDDTVHGHGKGNYHMLDQHYNEFRVISAGHGLPADLHEFMITPEGTALMTIYHTITVDVSMLDTRRRRGYIWDGVFQEMDLETGKVLFEWRASEHFDLRDSYRNIGNDGRRNEPWDWFHINSIDKDDKGNYLISSRYLRNLMYIDGKTGQVLWQLGGKNNNFTDLSDGAATVFAGQHDARWDLNFTAVTFFDNAGDWDTRIADHSRGVRIVLDQDKMTARLDQAYENPMKIMSTSQGSMQTLPNGNVVLGYGFNGATSEFYHNGTLACDFHFGPSSAFDSGNVQSYRNLRFNWTGLPTTPPNVVVKDEAVFVSWLGATEVRSWSIQDADRIDGKYEEVLSVDKGGFETIIRLTNETPLRKYIRLVAKDGKGQALGSSGVVILANDLVSMMESAILLRFSGRSDVLVLVGAAFLLFTTALIGFIWMRCGKRRSTDITIDSDDSGEEGEALMEERGRGRHVSWGSPFGRKAIRTTGRASPTTEKPTKPHRRNNSIVLSDTDLSDEEEEAGADARLLQPKS